MTEQEIQPGAGEAGEMARRHGLGTGDPVRVALLEADELDARFVKLLLDRVQAFLA